MIGVGSVPGLSLEKIYAADKAEGCDGNIISVARRLVQCEGKWVKRSCHGDFDLEKKGFEELPY